MLLAPMSLESGSRLFQLAHLIFDRGQEKRSVGGGEQGGGGGGGEEGVGREQQGGVGRWQRPRVGASWKGWVGGQEGVGGVVVAAI